MTALSVFAIIAIICITLMVIVQVSLVSLLIIAIRKLALRMRENIAPLAVKTNSALNVINTTAENTQSITEHFSESVEQMAFSVNNGIKRLSFIAHCTIAVPVIAFTAISEGFKRGIISWRELRIMRHKKWR